jgi:hypothetical protein
MVGRPADIDGRVLTAVSRPATIVCAVLTLEGVPAAPVSRPVAIDYRVLNTVNLPANAGDCPVQPVNLSKPLKTMKIEVFEEKIRFDCVSMDGFDPACSCRSAAMEIGRLRSRGATKESSPRREPWVNGRN